MTVRVTSENTYLKIRCLRTKNRQSQIGRAYNKKPSYERISLNTNAYGPGCLCMVSRYTYTFRLKSSGADLVNLFEFVFYFENKFKKLRTTVNRIERTQCNVP